MNKPLSLALLAGGIVLIIFGINASSSLGSDISRAFTGSPTDKAIWMLVGGSVDLALDPELAQDGGGDLLDRFAGRVDAADALAAHQLLGFLDLEAAIVQ